MLGLPLPSMDDVFKIHCLHRANSIFADATHHFHNLFSSLPFSKQYRALKARTCRLKEFLIYSHHYGNRNSHTFHQALYNFMYLLTG